MAIFLHRCMFYKSTDLIDGKPNIAYYAIADLKDPALNFTAEGKDKVRLTPFSVLPAISVSFADS